MPIRGGAIINIAGTTPVDDPEYRYKMPAVFGKIEGRGNGIKTVIPNIGDVAFSLHRDPAEVNKFFGCELGAQTKYTEQNSHAVINGAHTDGALQGLMHKYVEGFVICPTCGLPETEYKIKSEVIFHRCAACGSKHMLDMNHKLTTFILAQWKKKKKDKVKDKKKKDKDKEKGGTEKGSDEEDKDKDKDKKDKKKKDKKDKKKKDKKDKKKDKKKEDEGDGEDKNYLEKAMFGKNEGTLEEEADDADSVASEAGVDDEAALDLAIKGTKQWIKNNSNAPVEELAEVVANQQMASALKSHDKVRIIVKSLFTPQSIKNKEVEKHAEAIMKITNQKSIMERHLIGSLEELCIEKPQNFVVFLKQLYDNDALHEKTILEWADEGRSEYTLDAVDEGRRARLRGESEPLVVWLQDDSESEESDEEE